MAMRMASCPPMAWRGRVLAVQFPTPMPLRELAVGPDIPILDVLSRLAGEYRGGRLRLAVAWARLEGAAWLSTVARQRLSVSAIVGINERGTTVEALLHLHETCGELGVFFKHRSQTFHPKAYCVDNGGRPPSRATLFVGSSNLTRGGLLTNFEASLVATLHPRSSKGDRAALRQFDDAWDRLIGSEFYHPIHEIGDIERLYRAGYLSTENALRWQRRRETKREAPLRDLPTSPPPRGPRPPRVLIEIPFPLATDEQPSEAPAEEVDPSDVAPLADRFFVRTLTPNDIDKLHGRQVGTFEPDLGETARDRYPSFWGWPTSYRTVTRILPRDEWEASGRLLSSQTGPNGAHVTVMLWYRPEREGHAAEHRLRIGPISTVRSVVPPGFDTESLVIVEREPPDATYDFTIRLLTKTDAGYADYRTHLTVSRPRHQFGYGP